MEQFYNTFDAHFIIEMIYNGNRGGLIYEQYINEEKRNIILESCGVFDGCKELAEDISDRVLFAQLHDVPSFYVVPSKTPFIKKIMVSIVDGNSHYKSNSPINTNNQFDPLIVNVGTETIKKHRTIPVLMHKLTHAYEDYMRRIHGAESLFCFASKIGYGKNDLSKIVAQRHDFKNINDTIGLYLQAILYYLNEIERNAFIAQIKSEFDECGIIFDNAQEALKWVKQTIPYKNYITVFSYAYVLYTQKNKEIQYKIVNIANQLSNRNFMSFNQFKKWLINKTHKFKKKFDNIIPKIAASRLKVGSYFVSPDVVLPNVEDTRMD